MSATAAPRATIGRDRSFARSAATGTKAGRPPPPVFHAVGTVPLLLVGGIGDPATPYAWASGTLPYFPGSVLLTRDGDGHVSFGKSRCAGAYEAAYLTRLVLPPPDAVCPTD